MPACSACGHENRPGARFCDACGAPLADQGASTGEQRKTVTVLFADVTGSTALGERLDPESLRAVMARYFEVARNVVERHGGSVEKFIGDAVMAVFGVPVLHEDDALRAVRAAVDLRDGLAGLNETLERDYGTRLELRIGVNTGEVVTGTAERLATGDAVNVAARLQQTSRPGEILLGPETEVLVRDSAELEARAPLELKGKAAAVAAFRLVSVASTSPPPRSGPAMVGRARELERLRTAMAQAVTDRSCRLFTVLGAAGVGKSRLSHEFLDDLPGTTIVRGTCLSYGEGITTYWPVVEILKQLLGRDAERRLDELGIDRGASRPLLALLGEGGLQTSAEEIAWAFRHLLEAAAERMPLVVVLDDIHWGEDAFLDLVDHVADLSRDAPILLLRRRSRRRRTARPARSRRARADREPRSLGDRGDHRRRSAVPTGSFRRGRGVVDQVNAWAMKEDSDPQVGWRRIKAKILARRGELEAAELLGREAVETAARTDYLENHAAACADLAVVLELAGRPDEARLELEHALRLCEQKGIVPIADRIRSRLAAS